MTSSLKKLQDNFMSFKPLEKSGTQVVADSVKELKRESKETLTGKGDVYSYEKLILATGSKPIRPRIKGFELDNVFMIVKEFLKTAVDECPSAR